MKVIIKCKNLSEGQIIVNFKHNINILNCSKSIKWFKNKLCLDLQLQTTFIKYLHYLLNYSVYVTALLQLQRHFYRVKEIDIDYSVVYSPILKLETTNTQKGNQKCVYVLHGKLNRVNTLCLCGGAQSLSLIHIQMCIRDRCKLNRKGDKQ